MEIVGGFMVMMSIIGFFLAVIWLIMPFVVLAIKGKQDRTLDVLEGMAKQLQAIETRLQHLEQAPQPFVKSDSQHSETVSEHTEPDVTGA